MLQDVSGELLPLPKGFSGGVSLWSKGSIAGIRACVGKVLFHEGSCRLAAGFFTTSGFLDRRPTDMEEGETRDLAMRF